MFFLKGLLRLTLLAIISLILYSVPAFCQCAPLGGLANLQWFDSSGNPLTNGAVYVYQAGTSTQAPSYSDFMCTILNVNPVTMGVGGRAVMWLAAGTYKVVLCSVSTDGPVCAPAHILFSVDQLPAITSGGGGSSGAPFTSNSANPATTGILRLASGDQICWRNAANSANLCISKDTTDILTFFGATKYPLVGVPPCISGFDYIWADVTATRFKMCNNGGAPTQFVASGQDINTSDFVTQLHFGTTATPLSGTPPATGQFLQWNGSNIVGNGSVTPEWAWTGPFTVGTNVGSGAFNCGQAAPNFTQCTTTIFAFAHTIKRLTYVLNVAQNTCSTNGVLGIEDLTTSTVLASLTLTNSQALGYVDSGPLSVTTIAGDKIGFGLLTNPSGCTGQPSLAGLTALMQ